MKMIFEVDANLVEMANRGEEVMIAQGLTTEGIPVLMVIATGAHVGILKRHLKDILPGIKNLPNEIS